MDNINAYVEELNDPSIIILTETWLDNDEKHHYNMKGYKSVHSCRNSHGGGTAVYVREEIEFRTTDIVEAECCNIAGIYIDSLKLAVWAVYRPPNTDIKTFYQIFENILCKYPKCILIGDINIDILKKTKEVKNYKDIIKQNYLAIKNKDITRRHDRGGTLIDHVITQKDMECQITTRDSAISDHRLLIVNIKTNKKNDNETRSKKIKITNYSLFKESVLTSISTTQINNFDDLIKLVAESKRTSTTMKTIKQKGKAWSDPLTHKAIRKRDKYYKLMKINPTVDYYKKKFKLLKNRTNNYIRQKKKKYISKKLNEAGTSNRKTWNVINNILSPNKNKNKKNNIIEKINIDGKIYHTAKDKAKVLNKYFTQIAKTLRKKTKKAKRNIHNFNEVTNDKSIFMRQCTAKELKEIINKLPNKSSSGPDGLTARDIREIFCVIEKLLLEQINKSLKNGIFPKCCKISKVIPIHKKGKKDDPSNYRPISITSIFAKIFEKIIKNRLTEFFKISDSQYGFQNMSSTLGATADLMEHIIKKMEQKDHVITIFVDLQKAFDTINIKILLNKLRKMGIVGNAYKLLKSFLTGRKQYVQLHDHVSKELPIKSGVPQGTVLGPFLYLIYVESLANIGLECKYWMFADDTALVFNNKNEDELYQNINKDLGKFLDWLHINHLIINSQKTVFMEFKRKNKPTSPDKKILIDKVQIKNVKSYNYLGLTIDDKLTWDDHTDAIVRKLSGLIAALRKLSPYMNDKCRKMIYYSYIVSVLTYTMPIWSNTSQHNLNRLQRLQNKAIKSIYNLDNHTPTETLFKKFPYMNILKLKYFECCKFLFKIQNKLIKSKINLRKRAEIHGRNLRNANTFSNNMLRTNKGKQSPVYSSTVLFNELPQTIASTTNFKKFVKELEQYIIKNDCG